MIRRPSAISHVVFQSRWNVACMYVDNCSVDGLFLLETDETEPMFRENDGVFPRFVPTFLSLR